MLEKIRKLKDRKGFTLVELIVVLVILAILAALLVPALTGYIDKANQEKVAAECRQVVVAAQTEISEAYGKGTLASVSKDDILKLAEAKNGWNADIYYLSAADATTAGASNIAAGTVVKVVFTDGTNGCTYAWNTTNKDFEYTVNKGTTTLASATITAATSVAGTVASGD